MALFLIKYVYTKDFIQYLPIYIYNIYIHAHINPHSVQQNKAYARQNIVRLAWCRTRIGRVQYSINEFITAFYFEKSE